MLHNEQQSWESISNDIAVDPKTSVAFISLNLALSYTLSRRYNNFRFGIIFILLKFNFYILFVRLRTYFNFI